MFNRMTRAVLTLAAICACASLALAAAPTFWQVSNESEFAKGDVENLSTDSYGRLTLGPTATPLYETTAPFLWSMNDPGSAVTWAQRGVDPQHPDTALIGVLAEAHIRLGQIDAARAAIADGLAHDPQDRALLQLRRRIGA